MNMGEARMAEKESQFVAAMAGAVHALINEAERQQAAVSSLLKETRGAAIATVEAARTSKQSAETLPARIAGSLDQAFEQAAMQAADQLTNKFVDADKQALIAAERYEKAASSLGWRMILAACAFCALILALLTFLLMRSIPSYEEIRALQETVATLEQRGGRAQGASCPEIGRTSVMERE